MLFEDEEIVVVMMMEMRVRVDWDWDEEDYKIITKLILMTIHSTLPPLFPLNMKLVAYQDAISRLEICRDRRDRRSCKIFPSCVKFWGNNANSLGNY